MKTIDFFSKKYLVIGLSAATLPLAAMAHGAGPGPGEAPPEHREAGTPPGPMMSLPGFIPPPPLLHGIDLTEAQQDQLFELMLAQAPVERAKTREASKAMEELRQLAASGHFDTDKARALAEAQSQALTQLILLHAEREAKIRALLTPEQRKQFDASNGKRMHRR